MATANASKTKGPPEDWWVIYTRKSRALDRGIPEDELFRKHKDSLFRLARDKGMPGDLETQYHQEVGSSEILAGRPVFQGIMREIAALPYPARVHLLVMDQDRISRAAMGELGKILDDLKLKGTVLHQVYGGDLDLTDPHQYSMAGQKGLFNHSTIEIYKQKKKDACDMLLRNGEIRQGQVPWGYWWDKSEKLARDRAKADDREESRDWHPSEKGYGLTPWEKLVAICQAVRHTSIRQLALQYHVKVDTLYSTLETPTICGWPVTRTAPVMETEAAVDPTTGQTIMVETGKQLRDANGQVRRRKLPRAEWIWPEREGSYPKACTRQEWLEISDIIDSRCHGLVKSGDGVGICKDVVRIEGCAGMVLLGKKGGNKAKGWEGIATYRQLGTPGQTHQRDSRDVPRALVDAAAAAFLKALVTDAGFFAWVIREYHGARKAQEPETADRDMLNLNRRIAKLRADIEKAHQWAYDAGTPAEAARYQADERGFTAQIKACEREKAALKASRSPIPAVDAAMPYLLALADRDHPAQWGPHWDEIWAETPPELQRRLVNAWIQEIPVGYQKPIGAENGKPSGWYKGKATREVLPVVESRFLTEARAAYAQQSLSACEITSPQKVLGLWAEIAAMVPMARSQAARLVLA